MKRLLIPACCMVLIVACSKDAGDNNGQSNSGTSNAGATGTPVGAEGGEVEVDGVQVVIPAGALDSEVGIAVTTSALAVPGTLTAHSEVWSFGPEGQVFESPITITIPTDGTDPGLLRPYFTAQGSTEFEGLTPTAADDSSVSFEVSHFSSGFVGELQQCDGEEACREGACAADADCTYGGVCSLRLSDTDWRCHPSPSDCGGRCSASMCTARGLCSDDTM